jgi:lipoate-protein ligase A
VLLFTCPAADAALNFARDDTMLARARATGEHLLRVYTWEQPVISFGRNERVAGRFTADSVRRAGLAAARRPTGGRALCHHRELTYAMAGPTDPAESLRATYARINDMLARALRRFGIAVEVAACGTCAFAPPDGAPCFAEPAPGELTVEGRKLVASAQWRSAGAFLQHGSILIDDDQPRLQSALVEGATLAPVPPPATLRTLLGRAPSASEFADALFDAMRTETGDAPSRTVLERVLPAAEVDSRAERYRDAAWTWRR